ncbi:hypothetical protein CM15mP5_0920 [bacterium]|nr:MAG: hypothetical protein CM15mP5_0920 [bacterium]
MELILQVQLWIGMKIVPIKCDDDGKLILKDLEKQAIMNTFELSFYHGSSIYSWCI